MESRKWMEARQRVLKVAKVTWFLDGLVLRFCLWWFQIAMVC